MAGSGKITPFAGTSVRGKRDLKDHALELAALKRRIVQLTKEARRNEETWRNSQRREMALLESEDLPELLWHLSKGLCRSFRLDAASVALVDPDHEALSLLRAQRGKPDDLEGVFFVDSVGQLLPQLRGRIRPWLGAFAQTAHGNLFADRARLASVALLPLVRQSRIIGSLHFGSSDPERFTDTHATDFLAHFATMAAFGLENAINRARLVQRGITDELTGWHNRSYLDTRLREEIRRSQRELTSLVCLMLDVDHFKRINDKHGHAAGDVVLREVARRIGTEVRGSDVSARYGGEEFVVLLPRTGLESGRLLAERIRAAVAAQPFGAGVLEDPLAVTLSIGLAEYRPPGNREDAESAGKRLVAEADRALYEAKAAGRNAVALAAA